MNIDFDKFSDKLVPVVIQDHQTRIVLMLGYMNQEALDRTRALGRVTFYSRSKKRLWTKGESSGNYLGLVDIKVDCDGDALLIKVKPEGPVCHTGSDTCWGEENMAPLGFLSRLEQVIEERRTSGEASGSYVSSLFSEGINKIAQKVGEEAVELVIEAKDHDDDRFKNEAADLLFHYLVLLNARRTGLSEIVGVLKDRHQT